MAWTRYLPALGALAAAAGPACAGTLHHALSVQLEPERHWIEVRDTVSLEFQGDRPLQFALHAGLKPRVAGGDARLEPIPEGAPGAITERFRLIAPPGTRQVTLAYAGAIAHRVEARGEEYARSFGESAGIVSDDGVFLAASSYWYPRFGDEALSFRLEVTLPAGWRSVSQGRRETRIDASGKPREAWSEDQPQDEIYLVAGRFTEYRQQAGAAEAMVFLRAPDEALARKYLEATGRYVTMYEKLIGPYPYGKFALVENFWETGYGMPSFTLLGSKVIRLPFIVESSYPHEILHNWWGNSVYVDYAHGNWSEGLTSYLADHLLKEQRGQGAEHRRATLQKYTDYVRGQKDFPLAEFRGRHSAATEAVGYGKTLMLFHMLRQKLGDAEFAAGLQRLYRDRRFAVASFDDVRAAFESAADCRLGGFFDQWVRRTGAPQLQLESVAVSEANGRFKVTGTLKQTQGGPPYQLRVPVAVQLEGVERAWQGHVEFNQATQPFELDVPARPQRIAVDPEFDVFRRLHRDEIPPALSQVLGAERVLVVLPAGAPHALRQAYDELARSWARSRSADIEIRADAELKTLPPDRAVWIFGWENRWRGALAQALDGQAFRDSGDRLEIAGQALPADSNGAVVLARHPGNAELAIALVAAHDAAAVPGLGRKLPHYGKYSYLGFGGAEPENVLKGQWPVMRSPLTVTLDDKAASEWKFAPRPALIEPPAAFSLQRMLDDIAYLAVPEHEGRGLGSAGLEAAAEYIAKQFAQAGLKPGGDAGGYFQSWRAGVPGLGEDLRLRNVIGVLPGRNPALAGVVVSAHYDHLGKGWPDAHEGDTGKIHPGADDNASGVAVMLELARALAGKAAPEREIVFAAFTGEEAGRLGSTHYARTTQKALAVVNLDTVGRLGARELLVLGAGSAREWPHIFRGAGFVTGVSVKAVADDFGTSDQRSFIDAGVPGVQLFAGPHGDYHRPGDTPDKIDGAGLVKVARVLNEAVEYLGSRTEPLNVPPVQGEAPAGAAPPAAGRKVTLGTVPDFAHAGAGVRLSGVTPGTPAAAAGLQEGDVIVRINDREVRNLRDYGDVLRALAPGDKVTIHFHREGKDMNVTAIVIAR